MVANSTAPRVPTVTASDRAPFSGFLFLGAQLIVLVSVAIKPSPFRRLFFIPVFLIYWHLILHTTTGNIATDNPIGSLLATHLVTASDYILVTDVQHELQIKNPVKKERNISQDITEASFKERLIWGLKLMAATRGIGWTHEPTRYIRPGPKSGTPRVQFILHQLVRLAKLMLIFDIASIIGRWKVSTPSDPSTFLRHPWVMRFVGAASYGAPGMTAIDASYTIGGILSVGLGLSKPEEWPPLFGNLREGYTIRRFWSRVWHQMLRRPLLSHSKFITHQVLGVKPNTPLSRYFYLYIAFAISSLIHQTGERMMLGNWSGTAYFFFFGQAIGITIEEIAAYVARHLGIDSTRNVWFWKSIGFIWLGLWMTLTLDPIVSTMMVRHSDHFSIILGLWRGEWLPKVR
ncbi:hypothetical protein AX16_008541 [Volvariella volvacea WC 439]|nr:hypothetical protein AX16_008541 [Volvariella volvacea WC 439]